MTEYFNEDGTYNYAYSLFREEPSKNAAYFAAAVFAILFIAQTFLTVRYKTWFMNAVCVAGILESVGYGFRTLAIGKPFDIPYYAVQQTLIVVSPVLVAGSQYMMLEKIMVFVDESAAPVRPSLIAKVFVTTDIISLLTQSAGSGLLISSADLYDTGTNVLIGGLVVQVACYMAFLAIAGVFYHRVKSKYGRQHWVRLFVALLVSCILILLRSVFRVVEFAVGFFGPIATNEKYMYVFDFALLVGAFVILTAIHPGQYLKTRSGSAHSENEAPALNLDNV